MFLLASDSDRKHVHWMRAALFVEFGSSDPPQPPSKRQDTQVSSAYGVIHLLWPSTRWAGPHAPTVGAPSLLSVCHYALVNSTFYSVINHHLEGSAGS